MRPSTLLLIALLTPIASNLSAQSTSSRQSTVLTAPPSSIDCPVSLYVERRGQLEVFRADTSHAAPASPAQGLNLSFRHHEASAIASADVVVHTISPDSRLLPAGTPSASQTLTNFHLSPAPGSTTLRNTSLRLHNAGSVQWVEVASLQYADGSNWRKSKDSSCIAAPSPLLLVGALR